MRRPFSYLLVAATAAILYARTTQFDFVRADDADLIAGNQPFLTDPRNIPDAFSRGYFEVPGEPHGGKTYYRPVAIVSFMVDAARGGAEPSPYHVTNVVLHSAATSLVFGLASAWGASPAAALAAALVFAVHPANVQAVAWVAGRNDLLVAVFATLSVLLFPPGPASSSRGRAAAAGARQAIRAALHVLCVALALFAKEIALLLPLIALLQTRLLRRHVTRVAWITLACDGAVVAAWSALRAGALAGAPSELSLDTLHAAVVNAPQLLVHAGKIAAPLRLNVSPGVDAIGLATGIAAVALFGWTTRHQDRPRLFALGACWALAFLLPTLAVRGLPAYEHRLYVPLVGVLAGLAAAHTTSRPASLLVQGAMVMLVVTLAVATHRRQDVFHDPFTYWTDATRDPRFGPIGHVNLGQLHEAAGRPREARREYLRALERDPNTPKAHNNLGVVLMKLGEPALAYEHFTEETRRHPWNAEAWFNLGLWHESQGQRDRARAYYERARAAGMSDLPTEPEGREP